MRIIIFFFCTCSSLFSWYEVFEEDARSPRGVDERLSTESLNRNAYNWENPWDLKMLYNYARIARINEGIRFGCAGAIVAENMFATLLECDYHMFHYMQGSFPADAHSKTEYSTPEEIEDKFQKMIDDGLLYIYYGARNMHDGKFIKVQSMKKMETHMFLTTVEEFDEPADPQLPADTKFFNEALNDRSSFEDPNYQCLLFGFYRYDSYFLSHPKQPHIHAIRLKFNGREDQTNRPIIKLNNKELYNFGFLPTFEEYGTPIYCMKKDDKSLDRYKLVAFLDKTEMKTIKQLDDLRSTFKITKQDRSFVKEFGPMNERFRVKRDSYEIHFAVLQIDQAT